LKEKTSSTNCRLKLLRSKSRPMTPANKSKELKSKSVRTRGHTLSLRTRSKETSQISSL